MKEQRNRGSRSGSNAMQCQQGQWRQWTPSNQPGSHSPVTSHQTWANVIESSRLLIAASLNQQSIGGTARGINNCPERRGIVRRTERVGRVMDRDGRCGTRGETLRPLLHVCTFCIRLCASRLVTPSLVDAWKKRRCRAAIRSWLVDTEMMHFLVLPSFPLQTRVKKFTACGPTCV